MLIPTLVGELDKLKSVEYLPTYFSKKIKNTIWYFQAKVRLCLARTKSKAILGEITKDIGVTNFDTNISDDEIERFKKILGNERSNFPLDPNRFNPNS